MGGLEDSFGCGLTPYARDAHGQRGTVLLPLIPLTWEPALAAQLALAGINVVIGLVIICLVPVAAVRAR